MRLTRPAVALAVGVSLVVAGSAGAAVKKKVPPVCNLVIDDKGDGIGFVDDNDPGLDILSADIASNATKVSAVIRLDGAPLPAMSMNAPEGAAYYFTFTVPGAELPMWMAASAVLPSGWEYSMGAIEPGPTGGALYRTKEGVVEGKIDGNSIVMTADRSVLGTIGDVKPGAKITGLGAQSFTPLMVPGVGGSLPQADEATSAKSYTAGAKSCVTP